MAIKIHKKEDFEKMRKSGEVAAKTLDYITEICCTWCNN